MFGVGLRVDAKSTRACVGVQARICLAKKIKRMDSKTFQ